MFYDIKLSHSSLCLKSGQNRTRSTHYSRHHQKTTRSHKISISVLFGLYSHEITFPHMSNSSFQNTFAGKQIQQPTPLIKDHLL